MDTRLLVASFCVGALLFLGIVGAVPNAQLTVSEVTVEPGEPTVNESVTITPTIESSVGSDDPVTIDSVTATVGGEEIGNVTNEGTLSPGDAVAVPFTTSFDEPGEYTVEFEITGTDAEGETVSLTREESLVVSPVPSVRLTVDDVAVEPATPAAGEPVTIPVSVESSGGSTQPLDVDTVSLLDGNETLASAAEVGSLAVGDGITVPLTTTFETSGEKRLTAELRGTNANNESVVVRQPVSVVIEAGAPTLEFGNLSGVAGASSELSVRVSNPTEVTLRNVVATVGGDGVRGEIDRRVIPALEPGETNELTFVVQPGTAGEVLLETNVSYIGGSGTESTVTRATPVPVEPLDEAVSVRIQRVTGEAESSEPDLGVDVEGILDGGGDDTEATSDGDVRVTISNLGNTPVSSVVLEPRAGEQSLGPRPVADELAPGEEASVLVSLERTPPGEIVFEATYDVAGDQSSATRGFDPGSESGAVSVTGVNLDASGDSLTITGDIGNPGGSEISGVVVAVDGGEGISPAYPNRDFFVGEIESNGFAPFELTAAIDENATSVPVTVEYRVDGDLRTETVELPVDEPPDASSDDGPSPLLLGAVVAMLGVLLIAVVTFARQG